MNVADIGHESRTFGAVSFIEKVFFNSNHMSMKFIGFCKYKLKTRFFKFCLLMSLQAEINFILLMLSG